MAFKPLRTADRWVLAIVVILLDVVVFILPLTGIFAAYLLIARPAWFRQWVNAQYEAP